MSAIIIARGISYAFANGRELFSDLSFSLDTGLSALVGPNGVGKTSLAKVLAGELEPTGGYVQRHNRVALFAQRQAPEAVTVANFLSFHSEWSVHTERLLHNIDRDALCDTLSGGQWMRVRLARALGSAFLILDEPTNDLDREGRDAVISFLHHHRAGALLISHDRECLQLCEDVFELSNRGLARFGGGWSAYMGARQQERERLANALERTKRERDAMLAHRREQLAKQDKRNRHGAAAAKRGGAPKILLGARKGRAQATSAKLDAETLQKSQQAVRDAHEALSELKIDPVMYADLMGRDIAAQRLVAEAHQFNIRLQDWIYVRDLDFTWRGNVRVAVRGENGSGKSTLIKALLGGPFAIRGTFRRGELHALYLDQQCAVLDDDVSVLDNVRAASSAAESELRSGLARFLFAKETVFQKARELSGGERLRAALACGCLASHKPELLLLDEPTNNLDLMNIEFLEQVVSEFRGALIVVSHDERFLDRCGITQELVLPRRSP